MTVLDASPHHKQHTLLNLSDELWNKIKSIFLMEKSQDRWRRIVSYRKVIDGIPYVPRTGYSWRCYPKNTSRVLSVIASFRNRIALIYSKRCGAGYWKSMMTLSASTVHGNPSIVYP
ncbi:MAG TPA: transposase [Verrucomicrobiae bacterium]|nr:transposase [Verrucomicrobiae bacterium]